MSLDFNISIKETSYVNELLGIIMKEEKREISAKENMIIFYLKRFPNATRGDAEKDVDKIIRGVATFNQNLEDAKAGDEDWIVDKIHEAVKDLTNEQKYECMLSLLLALRAMDTEILLDKVSEGFDEQKRFEDLKRTTVKSVEGAVSDEQLKELDGLIKEAAENSGISIAGNSEIIDLIKELKENENAVKEFVENNWSDEDFKGYASFATYIAYLEGAVPSIPASTDPEVIAMGVTAGIERDKIIKKAALGEITWEVATKTLKIIGYVAMVGFMIWISIHVFSFLMTLGGAVFEATFNGSVLGFWAGTVFGGLLALKATEVLVYVGDDAATEVGEVYDKATNFIKETIMPNFKEKVKALWNFINEKILQGIIKIKIDEVETEAKINED